MFIKEFLNYFSSLKQQKISKKKAVTKAATRLWGGRFYGAVALDNIVIDILNSNFNYLFNYFLKKVKNAVKSRFFSFTFLNNKTKRRKDYIIFV